MIWGPRDMKAGSRISQQEQIAHEEDQGNLSQGWDNSQWWIPPRVTTQHLSPHRYSRGPLHMFVPFATFPLIKWKPKPVTNKTKQHCKISVPRCKHCLLYCEDCVSILSFWPWAMFCQSRACYRLYRVGKNTLVFTNTNNCFCWLE